MYYEDINVDAAEIAVSKTKENPVYARIIRVMKEQGFSERELIAHARAGVPMMPDIQVSLMYISRGEPVQYDWQDEYREMQATLLRAYALAVNPFYNEKPKI